jgi:hypothetical protein
MEPKVDKYARRHGNPRSLMDTLPPGARKTGSQGDLMSAAAVTAFALGHEDKAA